MLEYTVERYELTTNLEEYIEKYVDFNFTEGKCSLCSSYNIKWSCPSFDFDVNELWSGFENIKFIFQIFRFTDEFKKKNLPFEEFRENSRNLFQNEKRKIMAEMLEEEKRLNGLYLTCGPCNLCSTCSRIDNEPCRNPDLRRYAMESVGVNVVDTVRDFFDVTPQWITKDSSPDYHIFLNAILY